MFKKGLFLFIILAISLAFSSLFVNTKEKDETREVEDEIKEEVKYTVCTEWIGVYSSLEELVSDTEVIVTGEVISTESYPVNRLVFTRVYILVDSVQKGEIKQNDIITIVQLGGSYDDAFSPPPEEFPLMIEGKRYELYLKRNTSSNNNTYKVMGGYQGVLEIDENGNRNVLSEKNTIFLEDLNQITNNRDFGDTPLRQYYWDSSSLIAYVPLDIQTDYGNAVYSGICAGILTWRNNSDSPQITITNNSNATYDIDVSIVETADYAGISFTYYIDNICSEAHIDINFGVNTEYLTDIDYWKAVTCHEVGHVLGLGHNTSQDIDSIMKESTAYFYNPGSSLYISDPCPADIRPMNTKYSYHHYSYVDMGLFGGHDCICEGCGDTYNEEHVWMLHLSLYRCIRCGCESSFIPMYKNKTNQLIEEKEVQNERKFIETGISRI